MNNTANKIIGTLNAMQTLIENFPMWLFETKNSNISGINFIIEVLHQIGVNDYELIDRIVTLFFNVQNATQKFTSDTLSKLNNTQSEFLTNLENETKSIIFNILTAILSCSVIPKIPQQYFDNFDSDILPPHKIPVSALDTNNILSICPTTEIGKYYYDIDDSLTPNTLYKSQDLNAMLWYALNRGTFISQYEKNKLMWDSRFSEKQYDEYDRDTSEKWNYWINSKKDSSEESEEPPFPFFSVSGKEDEYREAYENHTTISEPLHPIIQFYPNLYGNSANIAYQISHETFSGKTIYNFNNDYLENIQIFNPKIIIAEMINNLLNGNLRNSLNIDISIEEKITDEKLQKLIAEIIEVDDAVIDDCFFTFSNDEFNDMIEEMERQRFSGKELNSETSPSINIDEHYALDLLNTISSSATLNERLATITRTVYEISEIPEKDESIYVSDRSSIGYNTKWLNDVIFSLIKPIVKSIFSPKVMMLFAINFDIMGLIKLDDINSYNDIMKLFYRKIMGAIVSIIRYIKDKIIIFLLKLYKEKIDPLLEQYKYIIIEEMNAEWLTLLEEAAMCIRTIFSWDKALTQIDDVRYADIIQEQIKPKTENKC